MGDYGISKRGALVTTRYMGLGCAVATPAAVAFDSDSVLIIAIMTFLATAFAASIAFSKFMAILGGTFSSALLISIPGLDMPIRFVPALTLTAFAISIFLLANQSLRADRSGSSAKA